jgi:hypothetical protein
MSDTGTGDVRQKIDSLTGQRRRMTNRETLRSRRGQLTALSGCVGHHRLLVATICDINRRRAEAM